MGGHSLWRRQLFSAEPAEGCSSGALARAEKYFFPEINGSGVTA